MNIYLRDQTPHLANHLQRLKGLSVMPYNPALLRHDRTSVLIDTDRYFSDIDVTALFAYNIFPLPIMNALTEWSYMSREMKAGDTIVQQIFVPPFRGFSQKLICGVRIKDIINDTNRKGFSYETLCGHVEKGISTFTLEQNDDEIVFVIETKSIPGHTLTRLLDQVFSRPYQSYCTRQGLNHIKSILEG